MSQLYQNSEPSAIRRALIIANERIKTEKEAQGTPTDFLVACIGNVKLPTYPTIQERMRDFSLDTYLSKGIIPYPATCGLPDAQQAFRNIIYSFLPEDQRPELHVIVADGSTPMMRLAILGVTETDGKPLLAFNPLYSNYPSIAQEHDREIVCLERKLTETGKWTTISPTQLEAAIIEHQPGALLIIPADNPTGQFTPQAIINEYARICLKHGIMIISDEAYRGLQYGGQQPSSVWRITDSEVPGIEQAGIRVSLETFSKVFNGCGLRVGALVTDNKEFFEKAERVQTKYLCGGYINQYLAGALAHDKGPEIQKWVKSLVDYYEPALSELRQGLLNSMPGIIVSSPDSSLYIVVDMRNIDPKFDATSFVDYCATTGKTIINGQPMSLLLAPMEGFYSLPPGQDNPGRTQMRISYVDKPERMNLLPKIFKGLYNQYLACTQK